MVSSTRNDKAVVIGFALIGLLVAAGILTDTVYFVAGGMVAAFVGGMVFAYPLLLGALLFGVQIAFTTSFLSVVTVYAGPFRLGIDDVLQLWIFFLWFGALVDGDGRVTFTRFGRMIWIMVFLSVAAFLHGVFSGSDTETAAVFLKSMMGYLFFFPALWLLKKPSGIRLLVGTILVASAIAAVWIVLRGYMGGEGVYVRQTSGLRVSSREANVVVVGLFLMAMLLWKQYGRVPAVVAIISMLVMGAAILLGQSRALWVAVAAGALIAFVADMGRMGHDGFRLSRLLSRIMLLFLFTVGSIAFVSAAGLLSAGDVAARGGGADGGLMGDVSLWARFLSWWEILRTVTVSPVTLLFGTGFGTTITYFRPDLMGRVSIPYVDGSFFQLLLNMGLSGALLLAFLYAGGIAESFRSVLNSKTERDTVLALWLTASFSALTIAALMSSLITNYRFTSLWAFLFALLETIRRRPENNTGQAEGRSS